MPEVQIRCPIGPKRLFMKLQLSDNEEDKPRTVPDLNLLELACSDCARTARKSNGQIFRILHRYWMTGEMAETVVVYEDGSEKVEPSAGQ
jgi:hypothetical protein